jgi:predicted DCC family thiol-disulfide oxidoreductase YuxK
MFDKDRREITALVLFDGVCPLCHHMVQWIIRHDPAGIFRFAPLQSTLAQKYIKEMKTPDSVVLLEKGQMYMESTAVLHICKHLQGFWKVAYLFLLLPQWVRDPIYRWIAKNRYRWFGKKESCIIPATDEVSSRFLDEKEVEDLLRKWVKK